MKNQLTDRQKDILDFLQNFIREKGYAPSLREIGKHFNIASTFGVKRHLDALVKKGYINVDNNLSRALKIVNLNHETDNQFSTEHNNEIPILGRVAAGQPVLAIENINGYVTVDQRMLRNNKSCFALKVKGDSMINAGIYEEDIIIVNPQNSASNGDIIVALLGDEATVKRFFINGNNLFLIPENENYSPIDVSSKEDFKIIGKVVGVIRWYN